MAAPNPGLLAAMLKAQRLNGVLRWKVNFSEAGFKGETNLAAWDGIWLETAEVKSLQEFIDVAAVQSSNPTVIGSTLADLVARLISSSGPTGGVCIAWSGWQDLIKHDPQAAQEIADALDLACQEQLAAVLVCDSVGSFKGISELSQG
jgi:hypothetical protein